MNLVDLEVAIQIVFTDRVMPFGPVKFPVSHTSAHIEYSSLELLLGKESVSSNLVQAVASCPACNLLEPETEICHL